MRKVSCRYTGNFLSLIFPHLASGSPYSKPDVQLFIMWYRGVKIIRNLSSVDYLHHRTPGSIPRSSLRLASAPQISRCRAPLRSPARPQPRRRRGCGVGPGRYLLSRRGGVRIAGREPGHSCKLPGGDTPYPPPQKNPGDDENFIKKSKSFSLAGKNKI
jgi:hypothetical protein